MGQMDGLELVAIGRQRHVEIQYENGKYLDLRGRVVEGVLDMACYSCMAPYYTFADEPIPFCPACGLIEGEDGFATFDELRRWANHQDWSYVTKTPRQVFGCSLHGGWVLKFARSSDELLRSGRYGDVRRIYPRS